MIRQVFISALASIARSLLMVLVLPLAWIGHAHAQAVTGSFTQPTLLVDGTCTNAGTATQFRTELTTTTSGSGNYRAYFLDANDLIINATPTFTAPVNNLLLTLATTLITPGAGPFRLVVSNNVQFPGSTFSGTEIPNTLGFDANALDPDCPAGMPAPEINVTGNGNTIADDPGHVPNAADGTDFGAIPVATGNQANTFVIENNGTGNLTLGGMPSITIGGADPGDFTITQTPTSPILPIGTTMFEITFDPSAVGIRTATVSIASDDADENPYDFNISGVGTSPPTFAKEFTPDVIGVGGTSTLTFTIDNSANAADANDLDFTDNFPAGLEIANPANPVNTCGGMGNPAPGVTNFAFSGGSVPAGGTCTVSFDVTPSTPGDKANTSGDLMSTLGNSGPATDTLTVTDGTANAAPEITIPANADTAAVEARENQTAVVDVGATDDNDLEGGGLTFSITGGADAALFSINPNTGDVTFNAAPDFENPGDAGGNNVYDVQVTVTDSGGLTDVIDIAVTVTDEDEVAPTVTIAAPENHDETGFMVTVTFSEPVTGFEDGELRATHATVGPLSPAGGAGTVFTATVTPDGPMDVVLSVPAGVAIDAARNVNTAADDVTVRGTVVERTRQVIASFMTNRGNNILSNQPGLYHYVTGANTNGSGELGYLAINGNEGSQTLRFSTSRSKILASRDRAIAERINEAFGPGEGAQTARTPATAGPVPDAGLDGPINQPTTGLFGQAADAALQPAGSSHALALSDPLGTASGIGADTRQAADAIGDAAALVYDRSGTWDIWTEVYGARSSADTSDASLLIAYLGAHYFVDNNTIIGILGQLDWADESNDATNSQADGFGWMIGPYIAGQLPGQNLYYEARAAWGTSDNDITPIGTYTDSFDTTRFLVSGKVAGSFVMGDVTMRPEVSVAWFEETQDAYTDSLGNAIAETTVSLGEVRFGPMISQTFHQADGSVFEPTFGISGVFNFAVDNNDVSQATVLGDDDFRARLDAGFTYTGPNGISLMLSGYYDGLGIDDYDAYGGRARVTVPLN